MNLHQPEIGNPAELTQIAPPIAGKTTTAGSHPFDFPLRRLVTTGLLVSVAILASCAFWILSTRLIPRLMSSREPGGEDGLVFLPEKSVAVLPFEDRSKSDSNAFPADGVQTEILTTLSKIADLKVISSTSVNGYTAGKPRNLREIAQTLGVTYFVEGGVSQSGENINVTVQLTDGRTGAPAWHQTYERDCDEVFAIVNDIAQRVISQLQLTVSVEEKKRIEEKPTEDLTAYRFYLRAKALAGTSISAQINERLLEAVRLLDQAIARDSNFYGAYCQLLAAHDQLYFFGFDHTPARLTAAESALAAVDRLRPQAPETHLARADFLYRCHLDYDRARAELELAEHAVPNNSQIFQLAGYIDRRQGRWNESARSLQRALGLDPQNFLILQQIALSYQEFRKFGSMAAALDRALALAPDDLDSRVTRALVDLEWKADSRPLHDLIKERFQQDRTRAADLADQWFYVAMCERDKAEASDVLAVMPPRGTSVDLNFPRSWCEGWVARLRGDETGAQTAFLTARAELQKTVSDAPNYGPNFMVLGLVDAVLGHKQEALQEGRHALELLPIAKDAIDGAELVKYLAVIYAWCDEKDRAIEQIATTLRIPSTLSYGNLKLHPYWDPLRGDSRFEKIVTNLDPKMSEARSGHPSDLSRWPDVKDVSNQGR
jgi:TolB-like protein/tetratricopeptide (TPR) repeat protein